MEYDKQEAVDRHYAGGMLAQGAGRAIGQTTAPRPADLFTLREELNRQVNRARELGYRLHNISDAVFGAVPVNIGLGNAAERETPTLCDLVGELDSALDNFERALSRL